MGPEEQRPGDGSWPNPYRQSGYQQPNPYGDGISGQGVPPPVPPPRDPRREARRTRVVLAVLSGALVLGIGAVIGAVVLSGGDIDENTSPADDRSPAAPEESSGRSVPPDDPRQAIARPPDPVVAPDWQVQTIEDWHNAFDVPPDDWELSAESYAMGVEVEVPGEEPNGEWAIGMMAPARYLDGWCPEAEYRVSSRASAGTRGGQGQGYSGTEEAAAAEARAWAVAAYDQQGQGTLEVSGAEPFDSGHGIVGHTATATVTGVPDDPDDPCGTWDGKVVTVSYLDSSNDLATWVLVADTGFPEELDDATIERIMNSLRPYPAGD
jgi:hypothetical protein